MRKRAAEAAVTEDDRLERLLEAAFEGGNGGMPSPTHVPPRPCDGRRLGGRGGAAAADANHDGVVGNRPRVLGQRRVAHLHSTSDTPLSDAVFPHNPPDGGMRIRAALLHALKRLCRESTPPRL